MLMKNGWVSLLVVLLLSACGESNKTTYDKIEEIPSTPSMSETSSTPETSSTTETAETPETPPAPSTPSTVPVETGKVFYIQNAENVNVATISQDGEKLKVDQPEGGLYGKNKSGKRKYYTAENQFRYAVKYKKNAFKLRDKNEELLWKVKLYENKIKVSNSEEMENAFEVRWSKNKLKVKRNGEELAAKKLQASEEVLDLGAFIITNFGSSLASGILLIDEIPDEEKFLICAELLMMNK